MKFKKIALATLIGFVSIALLSETSSAHSIFKKEMAKKYPDMKVSCNACHLKKQPKTEHSAFGKLFHKELASEEMTKAWKELKGAEKKEYETKTMAPAFQKALTKISAMTFHDLINAGVVNGIKDPNAPKKKKIRTCGQGIALTVAVRRTQRTQRRSSEDKPKK